MSIRDLTDFDKLKKTESQNKLLNLLNYSVSHEMITPLKCILNLAETALKDCLDEKLTRTLTLIIRTGKIL
jgi:light-regulated signal transduction histidine kinase (bacteriophytochrome)